MRAIKDFSINKKNNWLLKFFVGTVVFLFLFFIINLFVSPIKNTFYIISSPLQKGFWTAGESSSYFLASLLKARDMARQNEILKQENQKLLAQLAFLQSVARGNQAQSDVSVSCQNSGFKMIMAGVIGLDDNDILSINKGSVDGIAEEMPVVNQQNVLFGKVSKVYNNFSKVTLLSNKNSVVNVRVQQIDSTKSEVNGAVRGNGKLQAFLDLIPVDSELNSQDILVTSAIDKSFPKDLLVAQVGQIQKDDQKPFQRAQIKLFSDVSTTDNLFVITNHKQTK